MNAWAAGGMLAALLLAACAAPPQDHEPTTPTSFPLRPTPTGPFDVSSSAFRPMEAIPRTYSCDGDNVSPPLDLTDAPLNATHLALIMDDPDAPSGTVTHWTFWNLPANVTALPEHADMDAYGAREGQTYRGPCPPVGTHRYFFHAYATDRALDLPSGSDVDALRSALPGHVAAQDEMYGTYTRPSLPAG
jgi:Raf kinase inhibitor-like YbhB/YbcL family protein